MVPYEVRWTGAQTFEANRPGTGDGSERLQCIANFQNLGIVGPDVAP
jgi:hypothetical protein